MKALKRVFPFCAVVMLGACGNDHVSRPADDTAAPNMPAVQNVNGNIPDTSTSISLDNSALPQDSTRVDSTRR